MKDYNIYILIKWSKKKKIINRRQSLRKFYKS